MATVYGNTVNHWRAWADYSTSTTSAEFTITVLAFGTQAQNYGFDISSGITTTIYRSNEDTWSASGGMWSPYAGSDWTRHWEGSHTKSYSRKTSAYTVSIGVGATNASGFMNGSSASSAGDGDHSFTVPALDSYTVSYNANGGAGAPGGQTKWYGSILTLSSVAPTRTGYTFKGWATSTTGGVAYNAGGSYGADENVTLYAVWQVNTWSVSYNANGGTGAPAAQTKTYGVNLALSATKPTRTGYTFNNWNTAANGTGTSYASGASYIANAVATLYAQWTKISYIVSYNANGGAGAPAPQTKWYDETLAITNTIPTRDKYSFLGWATSASGVVAYNPGGSYIANAAVSLYAVWKLNYIEPTIHTLMCTRCTSNGTADNEGTYIRVNGTWAVDTTISGANKATGLKIEFMPTDGSTWTLFSNTNPNAATGTIASTIGNGAISAGKSYYVRVAVSDSGGNKQRQVVVGSSKRILDFGNSGKTIAIGKAASDVSGFECELPARFNGSVSLGVNGVYSQLADFVVAQGNSNGWSYRKWNSGRAECHKMLELDSVNTNIASGTLYYGLTGSIAFPFTFIETPVVNVDCVGLVTYGASVQSYTTGSLVLHTWATASTTLTNPEYLLYVSGRWF